MARRVRVGDTLELPSGRLMRVACASAPRRLWHTVGSGDNTWVCRAHGDPKAPNVEFYVDADSDGAVVFEEADAKAFVEMLNWYRY